MPPTAPGAHETPTAPADPVPQEEARPEPSHPNDPDDTRTPAAAPPAYRNLRVWSESFDLAIEVLRLSRVIEEAGGRPVSTRMIDASARVPVAVARGQSSGSGGAFIRCLHDALSDLSELETHLLMCAEMGYLGDDQVRGLEARVSRIRRMASALARRIRSGRDSQPEGHRRSGSRQSGSALLIAMIVAAALGLIGLTLLQVADIESRVSALDRDRAQLLNVAESGARAVKAWFDAPLSGPPSAVRHAFLGRFDLRDPARIIRSRRLIDADGNPATAPIAADGTPGREYYRQGRELLPLFPHLDLFSKPWRGDTVTLFLGTEKGPDLVLEDQPGRIDVIDEINAEMFGSQETTGRLERIEIYAPPAAPASPSVSRLGFVTIKVTAARYARLDRSAGIPQAPAGADPIARAVVRVGLAEIPTNAPHGPLESCGDLVSRGDLRARWGRVLAVGDIVLPDHMDRLDGAVASGYPYASFGRHITGTGAGGALGGWLADPDDSIEDPWLKVVAGGDLVGWSSLPDQPLPYDPARGPDLDHSNLFQRVAGIECASFDYTVWKGIVTSRLPSERHVHYFAYDVASGAFRENGAGPARSVRDWTDGEQGIFFFDTTDGLPPRPGNLTPAVRIASGAWSSAGLIYLNAVSFEADAIAGVPRVLLPPGEPFDDPDHDLRHDPGEAFVNLQYATAAGSGTPADRMIKNSVAAQSITATSPDGETYSITTSGGRDAKGTPILSPVSLFGVLYNAGDIVAEGDAVHYGSLVAGGNVVQRTWGASTPVIYFDERLNTGEWPPPEIAMPRTFVTFWQTSHP